MKKYNGWSNNATLKINLDILGNIEFEEPVTADDLKEIVEECVFRNPNTCDTPYLIEDYAKAFLKQVNYYEIAEAINTDMR